METMPDTPVAPSSPPTLDGTFTTEDFPTTETTDLFKTASETMASPPVSRRDMNETVTLTTQMDRQCGLAASPVRDNYPSPDIVVGHNNMNSTFAIDGVEPMEVDSNTMDVAKFGPVLADMSVIVPPPSVRLPPPPASR